MKIDDLFFFDIETAGFYKDEEVMEEENARMSECWTKRVQKKGVEDDKNYFVSNAPLLAEFARIVCVTFGYVHEGEYRTRSIHGEDELEILKQVKDVLDKVSKYRLCGFNIKNFDVPFLFKKFLSYGIVPPKCLNTFGKKPWEVDMVDLAEIWRGMSSSFYATFDEMAMSLGVDSPKDEIDGSYVHTYYHAGKVEEIAKYCEKDVKCVYECVLKIKDLI